MRINTVDGLRDFMQTIDIDDDPKDNIPVNNEVCPECDSTNIVENAAMGHHSCNDCHHVINNLYNGALDYNHYNNDDNSNRYSGPINPLLPQSSISTNIVGGPTKSRLKTLQSWGKVPFREGSIREVCKIITTKCFKLHLPKCICDDAQIRYKVRYDAIHQSGKNVGKYVIKRGANRIGIIAACIFFSCNKKKMARNPKEIEKVFNLKPKQFTRGLKNYRSLKPVKQSDTNMYTGKPEINSSFPEHYIKQFCSKLDIMNKEYIDYAYNIAKNIRKLDFVSEHNPYSIAIGSILIMSRIKKLKTITKKYLSKFSGVSVATIDKTYDRILQYRKIIINNEKTDIEIDRVNNITKLTISSKLQARFAKFGITHNDLIQPNNKIITITNFKDTYVNVKQQIHTFYDIVKQYEID
jgi:transcription initiation factor TFIIIB Brf1 subunit/transcription initiation factor TFIIB